MTAYAVIEMAITDLPAMLPYIAAAPATIAAHGGHYVVRPSMDQRSGNAEMTEGEPGAYPVKVIVAFASLAAGHAWYNSPEYQAIVPLRHASAACTMYWVEGVQDA
jgi:uncharacterized protein (DUF1330 family)